MRIQAAPTHDSCALVAELVLPLCILAIAAGGYWSTVPSRRIVGYFVLGACVVCGMAVWRKLCRKNAEEKFYLRIVPLTVVVLACASSLFFPIATVPDEGRHYVIAYQMSSLVSGQGQFESRKTDHDFIVSETTNGSAFRNSRILGGEVTADRWKVLQDLFTWTAEEGGNQILSDEAFGTPAASSLLPQCRWAVVAGILLGRVLGLSGMATFYLARLMNILYVSALLGVALKIMPAWKNVVTAVALLPMTLFLTGSCSYDGPIIGMACVLLALILKCLYSEERVDKGAVAAMLTVSALLAPCKIVYSLMAFGMYLIPAERFQSRRLGLALKISIPAAGVLVLLLTQGQNLMRIFTTPDPGTLNVRMGTQEAPGCFVSSSEILLHPAESVAMLARTMVLQADMLLRSMVGTQLGNLQANLIGPDVITTSFVCMLLMAILASGDDSEVLPARSRLWLAMLCLVMFLGIFVGIWVSWTYTTDTIISGLQGRYFLPFLPCLMVALRGGSVAARGSLRTLVVVALTSLDCILLMFMTIQVLAA